MSHVISITDAQIEQEVLLSDMPVLIDFYADWCGPCKTLSPRLETLAADYAGALKVVKIDVDANPMAVQMFRIQAMPTLALVHQQQVVDMAQGALDRNQLEEFVSSVVQKPAGGGVQAWEAKRLKLGLEAGVVAAVDVRAAADFGRARIPGAVNVPADELPARLEDLRAIPADVVLYGRTDNEVQDLAAKVAEAGIAIGYLEGGMLGWESEFYPIEK